MLNNNAYKQLQEMLNEAEQAHDFLEKSVEDFTYSVPHDVLKLLVQDALRWRTARQYVAIEDVEDWKSWPKFHDPSEEESVKADKALDEFMEDK